MLTACPVSFKICSFVFLPPDACNFQTQKIAFWKILKPRQYDNKNGKYKHIAETHFDSLVLPLQLISQADREYSIFLTPNYNTFLSLKIWIFFNKILKAHQLNMNKRKKKKKWQIWLPELEWGDLDLPFGIANVLLALSSFFMLIILNHLKTLN